MTFARAIIDPESRAADTPLRFILSAPGRKRDGLKLEMQRFRLDNFKRNPVMPWQHGMDPMRGALPVGRWRDVKLTRDDELVATAEFDNDDAFAAQVERKYRTGFLNAASISWMYDEDDKGEYYDMLEASAVSVPADPDALVEGRTLVLTSSEYRKLTDRVESLEKALKRQAIIDALTK